MTHQIGTSEKAILVYTMPIKFWCGSCTSPPKVVTYQDQSAANLVELRKEIIHHHMDAINNLVPLTKTYPISKFGRVCTSFSAPYCSFHGIVSKENQFYGYMVTTPKMFTDAVTDDGLMAFPASN